VSLQWAGMFLALVTFAGIAAGHVLVRRLHARFGTRPAIPLLVLGGLGLLLATVVLSDLLSGALGIAAVTVLWDGIEIYRQEKRIKK